MTLALPVIAQITQPVPHMLACRRAALYASIKTSRPRRYRDGDARLMRMQTGVFRPAHDHQVFDAVVGLIPVDVVNHLISQQSAPDVLLHNDPVQPSSREASRRGEHDVSLRVHRTRRTPPSVICTTWRTGLTSTQARTEAPPAAFNVPFTGKELGAAMFTDSGDGRLETHRSQSLRCRAGAVDAVPGFPIHKPKCITRAALARHLWLALEAS